MDSTHLNRHRVAMFRTLACGFFSLHCIQAAERTSNPNINVPAEPPSTAVRLIDAFPGAAFTKPLAFVSPDGDEKRLFVGELGGRILVIADVTTPPFLPSEVLDLNEVLTEPARVPAESLNKGFNQECGLLGFDFHPDFATNGFLYVFYSVRKSNDPAVWYQRLSRFTIPAGDIAGPAPVVDPGSEWMLLEQRDRGDNHNGGDVHFGPDGYLYLSLGDEGKPSDTYSNSQRIDMNFFGGLLRIDVDKKPGNLEPSLHPNPLAAAQGFSAADGIPRDETTPGSGVFKARYSIPADNPYVHQDLGGTWDGTLNGSAIGAGSLPYVRSEFWAIGLRSPWRFCIDEPTGDILLADVGESILLPAAPHAFEELNLITRGGNFGWPFREGTLSGRKTGPAGFTSIPPLYQIAHGYSLPPDLQARSLIGGVVYRGSRFASLNGAYIFGDYITGNIWALDRSTAPPSVRRITGQARLAAFGTDPHNGDVLVSDYNGGKIKRIVTTTNDVSFPNTLSATGLFTDLGTLAPASSVVPYSVRLPFWSDYAIKQRWFTIPDGTSRMNFSPDTPWSFPIGQIWIKHFELESKRGDPASPRKRIETRLLVRNASGAYGVSYKWNAAGTEATLAADAGESLMVEVEVGGLAQTQQWNIPSRAQCNACHTEQAGYALSFNTPQLNLDESIGTFTGNQLDFLNGRGYLVSPPPAAHLLPRHIRADETDFPIEARVRSYLAVNCSYCHSGDSSTAPGTWDGRHTTRLEDTRLVLGDSVSAPPPFKLIVPGDPSHSVVLQRIMGTGSGSRMPPLGTNEIDFASAQLLTDWITLSLPGWRSYSDWRKETFGSSDSAEGSPAFDADGDGATNLAEFIAGTLAKDGSDFLKPTIGLANNQVHLSCEAPANRTVQVETSENLVDWNLWDVPDNAPLPHKGGTKTFGGPSGDSSRFYRLKLLER